MVLGLYQSPPRIPVFLVLASKEFTAGSGRTGSPHRKDFVDIQSLEDSELLCAREHIYLSMPTAPHPLLLQNRQSFKDSHDHIHLFKDYQDNLQMGCMWREIPPIQFRQDLSLSGSETSCQHFLKLKGPSATSRAPKKAAHEVCFMCRLTASCQPEQGATGCLAQDMLISLLFLVQHKTRGVCLINNVNLGSESSRNTAFLSLRHIITFSSSQSVCQDSSLDS